MQSKKCASILSILVSTSVTIALASSGGEALAKAKARSYKTTTATVVAGINKAVVEEFKKGGSRVGGAEKLRARSCCTRPRMAQYQPGLKAKPISAGASPSFAVPML